jgi:phosphatidylglycerol phospholipase C
MQTMATRYHESDPLLARLPSQVAIPPMLLQPGVEQLGAPAQLSPSPSCSQLSFINPYSSTLKRRRPQCIAHRGYKAKHPENSMGAFRGAVNAGAHAIETDLQITKDDVVVLSHDPNLKRCFGQDFKIADKNWDEIKDLRTIQKPHERIPQLADLLYYLAEEGREDIWLFLDIKLSNDAEKIMRLIASTLASIPSQQTAPWQNRVVLGIWATKYLPPAQKHLPGFPMMHIAFSVPYARQFFEVANVGFNMMLYALLMPGGRRFLRDAQDKYKRKVLSWTINREDSMKWCIRKGLDGVVTDEVELYLDVAERFDENKEKEPWVPVSLKIIWAAMKAYVWVKVMLVFYSRKMGLQEVYGGLKKHDGKHKS